MKSSLRLTHRPELAIRHNAWSLSGSQDLARPAYVMAEAILGFAMLGVVLAGLFPFVLTELRMTRKLESRFQGNVTFRSRTFTTSGTYSCIPWKNPRMQALIGAASITTDPLHPEDDFTVTQIGSNTRVPVTIYSYQVTYPDSTGDPQVTVDVNVEVSP